MTTTQHKIALAICIALTAAVSVLAKSTEWLVTPQYDQMDYFAPDLYKVMRNGRIGLIDTEGHVVLTPEYDILYDFYQGMAVFGNYSSDGVVIKGSVREDKKVNFASGNYYFHDEYPFYSEGFIPAIDSSGRFGYLDEQCRPAFKFGNDETRPFSEGFAAVGEGDDFHWLTASGEKLFLSLPNGSYPYGGTNFYNGIAYLWDEDGKFFILEDNGGIRKTSARDLTVDYLYRVDSGLGRNIEYSEYEPRKSKLLRPIERNGKWAYFDSKNQPLTAYQYDQADYFQGTTARAKSGGKWGLIHVVEDNETFYATSNKKQLVFSQNKGCECAFQLSMPDKWKGQNLQINLRDSETGEKISLTMKGENEYYFTYQPDVTKTLISKSFDIEVKNGDIVLWQGEENYDFAQAIKLRTKLSVKNVADANNRCFVTATISNPSAIPVSTTVTLSGGGSNSIFKSQKVTITIPANGKRSVTSAFALNGVELDGWCAVATSDGVSARRSNLEMRPRD